MTQVSKKTIRAVELALLAAIIIVLQQIVIPLPGGLTLSLVLVPLAVGAILFGPLAGAGLGAVFGLVVTFLVITGRAGALSEMMWVQKPIITVIVCMAKGIAAGWVAGWLPRLCKKHSLLGVILAAGAAPIVNTGIFVLGMLTCFTDVVTEFAAANGIGSYSTVYIVLVILVGVNFLVELAANLLLSPAIDRIVRAVRKTQ